MYLAGLLPTAERYMAYGEQSGCVCCESTLWGIMQTVWMVGILLGGLLLSSSCRPEGQDGNPQDTLLAKVGSRQLYMQQLQGVSWPEADSAAYLQEYVQDWVMGELMIAYAERSPYLGQNIVADIEKKVDNYRKTLIRHAFEQQYIAAELNMNVSEEEMLRYYKEESTHFVLAEDILRLVYVRIPRRASGKTAFRAALQRRPLGDIRVVREYCMQHPTLCMLSEQNWISLQKVLGLLPERVRVQIARRVPQQRYFEAQDSTYLHMLRVLEYQTAGTIPPMNYIRQEIVHNTLSKRKKELLKALQEEIWNKAVLDRAFKIHL